MSNLDFVRLKEAMVKRSLVDEEVAAGISIASRRNNYARYDSEEKVTG